jgi:hypothetical protein
VEAIERVREGFLMALLLDAAEATGFDLFITADNNIRYRQNLAGRKISIVVLENPQWPVLRRYVAAGCCCRERRRARHLHRSGNPFRVINLSSIQ